MHDIRSGILVMIDVADFQAKVSHRVEFAKPELEFFVLALRWLGRVRLGHLGRPLAAPRTRSVLNLALGLVVGGRVGHID